MITARFALKVGIPSMRWKNWKKLLKLFLKGGAFYPSCSSPEKFLLWLMPRFDWTDLEYRFFSPLNFMFKYFTFPLYLIAIRRAASVTRFFKISPLWQKFTSLWQIFDGNDLAKCWAYFDKFMTILGKLSLSQIAKYWKIFQPSGHTDSSKQLFEKDVIGLLIGFEFLCR